MFTKFDGSGFFVASSIKENKDFYFSGFMVHKDSIIIGERGYSEYLKKNNTPCFDFFTDGRFSLCHINDERVEARTDLFGQEIIYYYFNEGVWALSNSFFLLFKYLENHGVKMTLDMDQARVLKVRHGFTQCLISNDTLINEIKVLPRDKILIIEKNKCELFFKNYEMTESQKDDNYVDSILNFRQRVADINHTLINYFKGRVSVDITGGVDSRLVLATLIASGVDLSDINFICAKGDNRDYEIASILAEKFGFSIKNKSFTYGQGSQDDLYELWKIGNLGVYNPVYFPSSSRPQKLIHFHGGCGECFRDFYQCEADSFLERVASTVDDKTVMASLNRKFGKTLTTIREPVNTKMAMLRHYFNSRSRFHFGRSAFRNLNDYIITPLSSPYLLYAFEKLSNEEKENGALILDVFLMLCQEIIDIPFDEESKSFSYDDVVKSRVYGVQKETIKPKNLEVYYVQEPRDERTNKERPLVDYMLEDLKNYENIVVASGVFSKEEVLLAEKVISRSGRQTMLAQDAAKIISLGEVLSVCLN